MATMMHSVVTSVCTSVCTNRVRRCMYSTLFNNSVLCLPVYGPVYLGLLTVNAILVGG